VAPVFVDGKLRTTLRGDGLVAEFIAILDDYVANRYGGVGDYRAVASNRLAKDLA
jgi:(E)-4-hydroxy-3-methylbut-2-enyl-diphosphate synthase